MHDSLNKNFYHNFLAPVAIVLCCIINYNAAAQQQKQSPILLSPPKKLAPLSEPRVGVDKGKIVGTSEVSTTQIGGVKIDNLQTIDPDTAGTLTKENGGFGADM